MSHKSQMNLLSYTRKVVLLSFIHLLLMAKRKDAWQPGQTGIFRTREREAARANEIGEIGVHKKEQKSWRR